MSKLDLYSLLVPGQPKMNKQDEADLEAYKALQKKELQTPVETYKPANLGDVYTGIKEGKGFGGKVVGGLSALLNYANTAEGKKIIAGMGSAGMAPGMLNESEMARQKETGLTSASLAREAGRKASIAELLKDTEKNKSEERKSINPEILRLLGIQQQNEFERPFKEAGLKKTEAETADIPSQRALEEKKAAQAAAEFNARQRQEADIKSGFFKKIRPQTIGETSGKTASGIEWRIKS